MGIIGRLLAARYYPDQIVGNIFEIDLYALQGRGITGLILDIDNTLARPGAMRPSRDVVAWLGAAKDMGFEMCILSNAGRRRAARFASGLGVFSIASAGKPGRRGYVKALRLMDRAAEQVCAVGDQLFTDVRGARRFGIYAIYTKPLTLWEVFTVILKRPPEAAVFRLCKHNTRISAN